MVKRKVSTLFIAVILIFVSVTGLYAEEKQTILFHLKTGLKHDDAQLCVAYNEIWAALKEGFKVEVLIDAGAVSTYKIGWFGKDKFEGYKIPKSLKEQLSKQFEVSIEKIPATYGEYLKLLKEEGANFYINGAMLVVAGIEEKFGTLENISTKFFKPVTLKEMIRLRTTADFYMVY